MIYVHNSMEIALAFHKWMLENEDRYKNCSETDIFNSFVYEAVVNYGRRMPMGTTFIYEATNRANEELAGMKKTIDFDMMFRIVKALNSMQWPK